MFSLSISHFCFLALIIFLFVHFVLIFLSPCHFSPSVRQQERGGERVPRPHEERLHCLQHGALQHRDRCGQSPTCTNLWSNRNNVKRSRFQAQITTKRQWWQIGAWWRIYSKTTAWFLIACDSVLNVLLSEKPDLGQRLLSVVMVTDGLAWVSGVAEKGPIHKML